MTKRSKELAAKLRALFAADLHDPDYHEKHVAYEIDAELRCAPWMPPLSQVWQREGIPPDYDKGKGAAWRQQWELLLRLRDECEASRKRD